MNDMPASFVFCMLLRLDILIYFVLMITFLIWDPKDIEIGNQEIIPNKLDLAPQKS